MLAYSCLVILAFVSLPAHLLVSAASADTDNTPAALPAATTPICEETVCPRLYMPVCGLVDGEQMTTASRCVLNNKIRCSSILQRTLGNTPTVSFLHNGPCLPKAGKSSAVRRSRDMVLESNEDDARKEEDDATKAGLADMEVETDDAEVEMDRAEEEDDDK
ncbi:uncharacterized protein [Bactrocera oleae]|uniref:uncharacterized protein isoform X2 n=1 Tax=Bactrocera oleae TaxID=104688 RepID=UPI00174E3336|nr:uncharacterized protein LOC118683661 isoform X2 [Bactrocera oleae]